MSLDVPQLLLRGPRIVGINQGAAVPGAFLPTLVELRRQGRFRTDELITHFAFDDIETAAAAMHHGEAIKPVLRFS